METLTDKFVFLVDLNEEPDYPGLYNFDVPNPIIKLYGDYVDKMCMHLYPMSKTTGVFVYNPRET